MYCISTGLSSAVRGSGRHQQTHSVLVTGRRRRTITSGCVCASSTLTREMVKLEEVEDVVEECDNLASTSSRFLRKLSSFSQSEMFHHSASALPTAAEKPMRRSGSVVGRRPSCGGGLWVTPVLPAWNKASLFERPSHLSYDGVYRAEP